MWIRPRHEGVSGRGDTAADLPHIKDVRRWPPSEHPREKAMRSLLEVRADADVVTASVLADDALMRGKHAL